MSKELTITFKISDEEAQDLEKVMATIQLEGILGGYTKIPRTELTPGLIAHYALHRLIMAIQESGFDTKDK